MLLDDRVSCAPSPYIVTLTPWFLFLFIRHVGIVKKPKCVPGDRTACVKIEVSTPISIETFNDCRALGRFALRSKGRTCAVGICDSVKSKGKEKSSRATTEKKKSA